MSTVQTTAFSSQSQTEHFSLYQAQSSSKQVFGTNLFPSYTTDYLQTQEGVKGKLLWICDKAHNGFTLLDQGLEALASGVGSVVSNILGSSLLKPVTDVICPINPINQHRHFVGISRGIEKMLGDWLLYPLVTSGMQQTQECLPGTKQAIADRVNHVFEHLKVANQDLLNPKDEKTQFNYRIQTIRSSEVNAFAVAGGGMVVFSQLVKELDGALKSNAIKEATVQFEDGSKATVDLTGVTLDDVLAALLGHEMTHSASRHSIVSIVGNAMRSILLAVGRFALLIYLKSVDKEYQALTQKPEAQRSEAEKAALESKENFYAKLNDIFAWIEDKIGGLLALFHSRKHEYEADVTGTYFTKKAGFNPLGAIYLQELFMKTNSNSISQWLHQHLEFLFTHPWGENRKRAIFAAIHEIDPQVLKNHTTKWEIADHGYDFRRANPAIKYAFEKSVL